MRQKFFTNTIQSKFIKSLLKTSYLPNLDSCRDGDYLIKGKTYVYKDKIIKCIESGFLNTSKEIQEKIKVYNLDTYDHENYQYTPKYKVDTNKPIKMSQNENIKQVGDLSTTDLDVGIEIVTAELSESSTNNISDAILNYFNDYDGKITKTLSGSIENNTIIFDQSIPERVLRFLKRLNEDIDFGNPSSILSSKVYYEIDGIQHENNIFYSLEHNNWLVDSQSTITALTCDIIFILKATFLLNILSADNIFIKTHGTIDRYDNLTGLEDGDILEYASYTTGDKFISLNLISDYSLINNLEIAVPLEFSTNSITIKKTGLNLFPSTNDPVKLPVCYYYQNGSVVTANNSRFGYKISLPPGKYSTMLKYKNNVTHSAFLTLEVLNPDGSVNPYSITAIKDRNENTVDLPDMVSGNSIGNQPFVITLDYGQSIVIFDNYSTSLSQAKYTFNLLNVTLQVGEIPRGFSEYKAEDIVISKAAIKATYGDYKIINLLLNENKRVGLQLDNGVNNFYIVDNTGHYQYYFIKCSYYNSLNNLTTPSLYAENINKLNTCRFTCTALNDGKILIHTSTNMYGDANGDGVFNTNDIDTIRKYITNWPGIKIDTRPYYADIRCSGIINNRQSYRMLQILYDRVDTTYLDLYTTISYYGKQANYSIISNYDYLLKTIDTQNFTSQVNYYDNLTHKNLGKLLRYKRDLEDLNLMPFYNCFCGRWLSNIHINDDYSIDISNTNKYNTKCALVPIKFNKNYYISLDCPGKVKIVPIIMNNGFLQKAKIDLQDVDLTSIVKSIPDSCVEYNKTRFNYPISYGIYTSRNENEEFIACYENYLYILIQINTSVETSLTVLEGDFNTKYINYILDYEWESSVNDNRVFDKYCLSNLSLLKMSDGISYPFADRLIEYLLLNVIDNRDSNPNNVLLMQNYSLAYKENRLTQGIYRDYYRRAVYKGITNSNNSLYDITGFVDKDTEKFLKGR